jgi:hypothetical protein
VALMSSSETRGRYNEGYNCGDGLWLINWRREVLGFPATSQVRRSKGRSVSGIPTKVNEVASLSKAATLLSKGTIQPRRLIASFNFVGSEVQLLGIAVCRGSSLKTRPNLC